MNKNHTQDGGWCDFSMDSLETNGTWHDLLSINSSTHNWVRLAVADLSCWGISTAGAEWYSRKCPWVQLPCLESVTVLSVYSILRMYGFRMYFPFFPPFLETPHMTSHISSCQVLRSAIWHLWTQILSELMINKAILECFHTTRRLGMSIDVARLPIAGLVLDITLVQTARASMRRDAQREVLKKFSPLSLHNFTC